MLNHFIYDHFSLHGIYDAYNKNYDINHDKGLIIFPENIGKGYLQGLSIPGGIDVMFAEYEYTEDILLEHLPENEQRFALWLDYAETDYQQFTYDDKIFTQVEAKQQQAFLMNAVFRYKQFRTKGTKGKSLTIFIPPYLLEGFLKQYNNESLLGKFYEFQCKGVALQKLSEIELRKINSFFYQWKKHKNIVSLTKYTFQLLEWYFKGLIKHINEDNAVQKLLPAEAIDLICLEKFIKDSVLLTQLDIQSADLKINTPIKKLKQLFEVLHTKTIVDYFKEYKMKEAKKQLINTDKNIAEIAYEYGYANPSNFSAFFKKYYNLSPQEFRQQLKEI